MIIKHNVIGKFADPCLDISLFASNSIKMLISCITTDHLKNVQCFCNRCLTSINSKAKIKKMEMFTLTCTKLITCYYYSNIFEFFIFILSTFLLGKYIFKDNSKSVNTRVDLYRDFSSSWTLSGKPWEKETQWKQSDDGRKPVPDCDTVS